VDACRRGTPGADPQNNAALARRPGQGGQKCALGGATGCRAAAGGTAAVAERRLEREVEEGGGTTSREPVARVTAVEVQQVMCHRTWGGLLATDFEPQRHSLMVLGRPAQAA